MTDTDLSSEELIGAWPKVKLLSRPVARNWPENVASDFVRDLFSVTSEFVGFPATPEIFSTVSQRMNELINDYKERGYIPETNEGFIIGARTESGQQSGSMIVTLLIEPFQQLVLDE